MGAELREFPPIEELEPVTVSVWDMAEGRRKIGIHGWIISEYLAIVAWADGVYSLTHRRTGFALARCRSVDPLLDIAETLATHVRALSKLNVRKRFDGQYAPNPQWAANEIRALIPEDMRA